MVSSICRTSAVIVTFGQCLISVLTQVVVRDNATAVKGQSIQLICQGILTGTSYAEIFKTDHETLVASEVYLNRCVRDTCLPESIPRYDFAADKNNIYINIAGLQRTEDEKWWTCVYSSTVMKRFITVYTVPASLTFINPPTDNKDLALNEVILRCETGCSYPAPEIKWFYIEENSQKQQWLTEATTSSSVNSCTDSEKKYSSKLILPIYTVFNGNSDTSVRFQCGITNFAGISELLSALTVEIRFAVKVTVVSLQNGSYILTDTSKLQVISGENTTLTCIPNACRPEAKFAWYIDNTTQQSQSSNFTFVPTESHHNKRVYCKAYNFGNSNEGVLSGKPVLDVLVRVKSATIKDGNVDAASRVIVFENQNKTLTCLTSFARPAPTVVWFIRNIERDRSSLSFSFTFTPTKQDHGSEIYCKAFNVQNETNAVESATLVLYVKVPESQPTFSNHTKDGLILLSGDPVSLECLSSETRPAVTVVWTFNNKNQSNITNYESTIAGDFFIVKSVVIITPQNADDSQYISCQMYVEGQESRPLTTQLIRVYWPPLSPLIVPNESFPWMAGRTNNVLNCTSADFGNPRAVTSWNMNGQAISGNPSTLQMPLLSPQHNGMTISCMLVNAYTQRKGQNVTSTTILNVEYEPLIRVLIDGKEGLYVERNEGVDLNATCTATGNPYPTYKWIRNNKPEILFNSIDRGDDGIYICKAVATSLKNGELSSSKQLNITVLYAPTVSVEFSGTLEENKTMTIRCKALGKPAFYTYSNLTQIWNGQLIRTIDMHQNAEITLTNPAIHDSGNYTCKVSNGVPDRSGVEVQAGTEAVLLKGKPKVSQKAQRVFTGRIDESLNITLPFYSYPVVTQVEYRNENGTTISDSFKYETTFPRRKIEDVFYNSLVELDGYHGILRISQLEESDFRNYTLFLRNDKGINVWEFQLTSKSKPQAPKYFKLTLIENGFARFMLEAGFNGGLPQIFVIETRIYGSSEWVERLKINEDDKSYKLPNGSYIFNISGLKPEKYSVRVVAENALGRIEDSQGITVDVTIEGPVESSHKLPVAAIGGAIGSVAAVICLAVVVIIVWKKRFSDQGTEKSKLAVNTKRRQSTDDEDSDEDVIVENKMYESAGAIMTKDEPVYNKPTKKAKIDQKNIDVYAVVDKTKKKDVKKMKKETPKKKTQFTGGEIYENATFEDNPYENPEASKPSMTPKKNINPDGLIYADLAFNDQPKGQKKLVIHGLDEMTTYVQVDFTKKADPLPDSDTEGQSENKKR